MTDPSKTTKNAITVTPASHPKHGRVWRLEATQILDHPVADVFPFFADAYNLENLTPSFLKFNVLTPKPIEMRSGLILKYKLKVRGLPIRWTTEILDWDPPHKFVDNQAKGPYALWHHTHTFEAIDGGARTLCRDVVQYRPAGWVLAPIVNKFLVQKDVENIFRFRFEKLEEFFPARDVSPAADEPLREPVAV